MKQLFAAALAMLALAGCTTVTNAINDITQAQLTPSVVVIAVNAFDAVKVTAKNYIAYCTPVPSPAGCNDTVIQTELDPAIKAGTTARNSLEAFMAANPGAVSDVSLYDALKTATATIEQVVSAFNG